MVHCIFLGRSQLKTISTLYAKESKCYHTLSYDNVTHYHNNVEVKTQASERSESSKPSPVITLLLPLCSPLAGSGKALGKPQDRLPPEQCQSLPRRPG